MKPLPRSEVFNLEAAEGWLMLGNPLEANEEMAKVNCEFRFHPLVLATRWEIYTALRWWDVAWVVSRFLCRSEPDYPTFWICQASSLRHCRGIKEANKLLLSVADRFPKEPIIAYNLACYACQLGRMGDACKWLLRAFHGDQTRKLQRSALRDSDLAPLWTRIEASVLVSFRPQHEACSD